MVERVGDRSARQPVIEIAEDHHERVTDRIEIGQQPCDLESTLTDAQPEMGGQEMHVCAVDVDGGRQSPAWLAAIDGQIETLDIDNRMACQQGVAEAAQSRASAPTRTDSCRA